LFDTPALFDTIVLAIVQGIAEFLPISSSGHLVILGALLGDLAKAPTLEIILHAGTLGSILVVYWRRIFDLLRRDRRVVPLLIVGTLPAAVIGILIKSKFEWVLRMPSLAGAMLLVTAVMLLWLWRLKPRDGEYAAMSVRSAFLVGCFQAFAILPGISRSGSTILGGRLLGLRNDDSVTFSFLLAIPAIAGATVLEVADVWKGYQANPGSLATPLEHLAGGAVVAFVVGIFALRWLIRWSDKNQLHWFAAWCFPAGLAVLVLAALGKI